MLDSQYDNSHRHMNQIYMLAYSLEKYLLKNGYELMKAKSGWFWSIFGLAA